MANVIIIKNDSAAANVPAAGELVEGELAINVADKKLYSKTSTTVFQVFDGVYAPVASPTFTGTVTSPNYNATTIASAYQIAGDTAISEVSGWLYVNGTNVFTSGVYCGNTILRTDGELQVGTAGANFKVTSTGVVTATSFAGSGAGLTALTAANISAGSLASGVNSYFSVNSTNAAFKVPFLGTTGTSAVNTGMSHDTTATFTYNPSTNNLAAGSFNGVALTTGGAATNFLNETGAYSAPTGGSGTVTEVSSGNGMNFTAISTTGPVTMGTPSDITASSTSTTSSVSHSHAITGFIPATGGTFTGNVILDGPVTTTDFGTGGQVKDGTDVARPIGFNVMPVYEIDVADTFDLAHVGMIWHKDAGGALSFTFANDATIPQGATYVVHNDDTEDVTIAQSTTTIYWIEGGFAKAAGNVVVAGGGIVTVYKYSDTVAWVWGSKDAAGAGGTSEINGKTASYTMLLTDATKTIRFTGATASKVCTIPANASVAYPIGTMIGVTNDGSVTMTLVITTDTMTWGKDNTTGTRTLAAGADAVLLKTTATTWKVNGSALVT